MKVNDIIQALKAGQPFEVGGVGYQRASSSNAVLVGNGEGAAYIPCQRYEIDNNLNMPAVILYGDNDTAMCFLYEDNAA